MAWRAVLRVLTLSLPLMLVTAEARVLHDHRAIGPALYDEGCPLSQLAASSNEFGLPRVVDVVQPLPAVDIAPPPTSRGRSGTSVLPFRPRGPPITA
jgi:hypothetical protein